MMKLFGLLLFFTSISSAFAGPIVSRGENTHMEIYKGMVISWGDWPERIYGEMKEEPFQPEEPDSPFIFIKKNENIICAVLKKNIRINGVVSNYMCQFQYNVSAP